ncbi:hypothetical protein HDR59_01460 [bacterium]|nr:hypothetical protein [bacterium]
MKVKLWNFIKKHTILRKIFFWLFSVMGMSVKANALYSCKPCPNGLQSNPEARSSADCFDPKTKASDNIIFKNGTASTSGALMPGWYRISIRGANGNNKSCSFSYTEGFRKYSGTVSASGGNGGVEFYVFYVQKYSTYTYEYNNGSPKFTLNQNGRKMVFTTKIGNDASCSYQTRSGGNYCVCSNGAAGSADVEGLFSNTFEVRNVDNFGSIGAILKKL